MQVIWKIYDRGEGGAAQFLSEIPCARNHQPKFLRTAEIETAVFIGNEGVLRRSSAF